MGLFDRTAKRLADGPTLLFPADPAEAMAEAVLRYDPEVRVRGDRFVFGNGVLLYGPVEITPDVAAKAGLPGGVAAAYHAGIALQGSRDRRPEEAKWRDAERLIRGLAARLDGAVHDSRPPIALPMRVSVYSATQLPPDPVIGVLRPFLGDLAVKMDDELPDCYFIGGSEIDFVIVFWPSRFAAWKKEPPPPALGPLREQMPCRWQFRADVPAADADRDLCLQVGEGALALARHTGGVAIDPYWFPFTSTEELVPR
jgi:hypothetical protein